MTYPMKVILETHHEYLIRYLCLYYYLWVDISDDGQLIPDGIIIPAVNTYFDTYMDY